MTARDRGVIGTALVAGLATFAGAPARADDPGRFGAVVRPLVARYCLECHSAEEQEGEVDLERFAEIDQARRAPATWQKVGEVLAGGSMPPEGSPQPSAGERAALADWTRAFLAAEATRRAGDPGRVVLRRLDNAEYTYTLRDLTGLAALDPAREFPADGAAGEGFSNVGQALVMSPSLVTKYLDAAKAVAAHAELTPDGFRFAPGATPRDWSEATLARIRHLYARYTEATPGGDKVNLQGIVLETNGEGRLPVRAYLAAAVEEREALEAGTRTIAQVASARGLSPRYLGTLWEALRQDKPSALLGQVQARWRTARPGDVGSLAAEVSAWQRSLWTFNTVGHIGKLDGPTRWMAPTDPIASSRAVRLKLPPPADPEADVAVDLLVGDAGDGPSGDAVAWLEPRLVAPGRPELLVRDIRAYTAALAGRRARLFAATASLLEAVAAIDAAGSPRPTVASLARERGVDPDALRAWLDLLGVVPGDPRVALDHLERPVRGAGGHEAVSGWGRADLPVVLANASDQAVRIPGLAPPRGVVVHPTPTGRVVVAWEAPEAVEVRARAAIGHAHHDCGNGVDWRLERRAGTTRQALAGGTAHKERTGEARLDAPLAVEAGEVIALSVGPRDGNHGCDLTAVTLTITEEGPNGRTWDLAADVAPDILAGNPHADRLGHPGVWHFATEPDRPGAGPSPAPTPLPAGSILARWRGATDLAERHRLAGEVEHWLAAGDPEPGAPAPPDAALRRSLRAIDGPLLGATLRTRPIDPSREAGPIAPDSPWASIGLDPARFGVAPEGFMGIDPASLAVRAPGAVSFRVPAELADGADLVTVATLIAEPTGAGSVQVDARVGSGSGAGSGAAPPAPALRAGGSGIVTGGNWLLTDRRATHDAPILVRPGSAAEARIAASFDDFRALFPAALCYGRVVPVDEVVTLTQYYREDDHLRRLMLDDAESAELDRLWAELHFTSRDALTQVDALAQLLEYATQDASPRVFEPLRQPFAERADAFRRQLVSSEPAQLDALLRFADRAYRRPLAPAEAEGLRSLYARLRAEAIPHDEAFRLVLARVLAAPAFLYKAEAPGPGASPGPVGPHALAVRLSYFLGSTAPDEALRSKADSGALIEPDALLGEAHRLLRGERARRLATEFAARWLQIRDLATLDEKSERHFPTFLGLRGAMHEESIRSLADLFERDGSILDLIDGDATFLNRSLAEHYAIPFDPAAGPDEWRRVEGLRGFGRGGILGQAAPLAQHSGASRTSPTLRGDWISEVWLGERLPRPPKGVPLLPEDEAATAGLSVRQLVEAHAKDARCAGCHSRIDPLGFALEGFDAIGRRRATDAGGRPIDSRTALRDGAALDGLPGLQNYLRTARRDAFARQFCRKLLGFALGRSVQLSDEPLLAAMLADLPARDYRVRAAIDRVVLSPQFRNIRGAERADDE